MKIKISRQHIYLLSVSVFLLIFVFVFSFAVLIPHGKEYREARIEMKKGAKELRKYQDFSDETAATLKDLEVKNRHIIKAYTQKFNAVRFEKQHKSYFSKLHVSPLVPTAQEKGFDVYEVNTTSQISSPKSFYNFLDAVNKSDWIIAVNFPINFKRDGEMIKSSFRMKVYNNAKKEDNTSKSVAK